MTDETAKISVLNRLSEKFIPVTESGCWIWIGADKGNGYGNAWHNGKHKPAHRAVYEEIIGEVPEGLDLDHLCRVRACVNPAHLEPVTRSENLKRGEAGENIAMIQREKTHCKRGHEFTPENTRIYRGKRCCRACARVHYHNRKGK